MIFQFRIILIFNERSLTGQYGLFKQLRAIQRLKIITKNVQTTVKIILF